jgi:hypothetical protein
MPRNSSEATTGNLIERVEVTLIDGLVDQVADKILVVLGHGTVLQCGA